MLRNIYLQFSMVIGGKTESEVYLSQVCQNSFLSLWSVPNIFKSPGKELCDLLVVFENNIIIFSDKSCEYKYTESVFNDWERWYKRAVIKSANQLYGAEKWIKKFPNQIYLDAKCKISFPLPLPNPEKAKIYRDTNCQCAERIRKW